MKNKEMKDTTGNLQIKIFYSSTIVGLQNKVTKWLDSKNVCIGNYVDIKIQTLNSIYILSLIIAKVDNLKEITTKSNKE